MQRLQLKVGGTITPGEHIYIVRPADHELWSCLRQGDYCSILTSRQMGKSSLVARTAVQLAEEGVQVAALEATLLGRPADPGTWYQGLLEEIVQDLKLDIDVRDWWRSTSSSTPHQLFAAFLRRELVPRVNRPIVIAIDEIDTVLRLDYRDEIFATIRSIYNQRSKTPEYRQITFCLVGAAAPSDLIIDKHTTPYNIGTAIALDDFDIERDDLQPFYDILARGRAASRSDHRSASHHGPIIKVQFARRLGANWRDLADWFEIPIHDQRRFVPGDEARAIWAWLEQRDRLWELGPALESIERGDLVRLFDDQHRPNDGQGESSEGLLRSILYWTDGHPYLTARLCQACMDASGPSLLDVDLDVDSLVDEAYPGYNKVRLDPHFQQIISFLTEQVDEKDAVLSTYLRILDGREVDDDNTVLHIKLKLSGIVKRNQDQKLVVRNRIYQRVFDKDWAIKNLQLGHRRSSYDVTSVAEHLDILYDRRLRLIASGIDHAEIDDKILELRRRLRAGPQQLQSGDLLHDGRFELIRPLGQGGSAKVWQAYDNHLETIVAIKILHEQYSEDQARRERFFRGARTMAELRHPNIVWVVDVYSDDDGRSYFVMEYIAGNSFRDGVLHGALSTAEKIRVILEAGSALVYTHERGLLHRDVKPANILLDVNNAAKLTDFDLVRVLDATGGTRTGTLGTWLYVAPEQLNQADRVDAAADVYSLAVTTLFALSSGDPPMDFFRDPAGFVSELSIPSALQQALINATKWDPKARTSQMAQFCEELARSVGDVHLHRNPSHALAH